ncbi:hypothetical protein SDC9_168785 [bioreactor metagenome]|uniref:Uncharacterized protein n=1 Tax=bioreactor metagenome TaxID=1076179 RepID=A0A645G5K5_9ZZZZ
MNSRVDISDLMFVGEGEIEFIIPSGVAVSKTIATGTVDTVNKQLIIDYKGTAPSYPLIMFKPLADLKGFQLELKCIETGNRVTLRGDFYSSTVNYIDNAKRSLDGSFANFDMSYVQILLTEWIQLPYEGVYHITYNTNIDSNWQITAPIYYL